MAPWLRATLVITLLAAGACSGAASEYESGVQAWSDGRYNDAVQTLREITRRHPQSEYAPRGLLRAAQIQAQDLRQYDAAEDNYQLFLKLYPQSAYAEQALEELVLLLFEKKRDFRKSVGECQRFIESFPASPRAPAMYRRIVESYIGLREFEQARVEAGIFLRKYPGHALADDTAYDVVRSWFIEGVNEMVVEAGREFAAAHTTSALAPRARFLVAAAYEEMDHMQDALAAYREARDGHPDPAVVDSKIDALLDRLDRKNR